MTELYLGVRDGYSAAQVASGAWTSSDGQIAPNYLAEGAQPASRDGEDLFADYAHLVQRRDH